MQRGSVWLCSARWHHVHNSRMYMYIKVVMTYIHGQVECIEYCNGLQKIIGGSELVNATGN